MEKEGGLLSVLAQNYSESTGVPIPVRRDLVHPT